MTRRRRMLGPGTLQRLSSIIAACSLPAVVASSLHGLRRLTPTDRLKVEGEALGLGGLLKTGTTIAGVICGDAVILAADTRSTMGRIVANKNCEKIHVISDSIYCCGAGTAADADRLTGAVKTWLRLEQLRSIMSIGDQDALPSPRVAAAAAGLSRLLSGGGNENGEGGGRRKPSAAFVLGGVDATGPHLYQIESCGTAQEVAFTALGSGSLAAISALEAQYRRNMTLEEGRALLVDAITAGILNDMGSGSNVDMCVIRKGVPVEYTRGYVGGYRRTDAGGEKGREQALRVLVGGREGRSKEIGSRACRSETLRLVDDERSVLGVGGEGLSSRQRFVAAVTDMPDDQVEFL